MTRIIGAPRSRRRHWTFLACFVAALSVGVLFIGGAQAVHDLQFELDGNVAVTSTHDWASFFDGSGTGGSIGGPISGSLNTSATTTCASVSPPLTCGFTAAGGDQDFATTTNNKGATVFDTTDTSTFTQGSKDLDDVSKWVCTPANNVTNKGDILNTYAVAYTDQNVDPATGKHDQILYFGLERSTNTGDANVAFWFLQDGSVSCSSSGGTFSGNHSDGDILIVSAFTKGGGVSTINAYRWNGNATTGSLGTTPVASGGDCTDPSAPSGDPSCATSNKVSLSGVPWLTYNSTFGLGNKIDTGEFFEGGLNLTKSNLGGKCFNTFLADTRSSQQLTATLYDFAKGTLGECTSSVSTTAAGVASPGTIGTGSVSSGTDTATVTVTGLPTWGGTVDFYLCGPIASGTCDSNGLKVNPAANPNGVPVGSNTSNQATSGTATLTSAGRYCWFGVFTPDTDTSNAGVKSANDNGSTKDPNPECFNVAKVTPTLATQAVIPAAPPATGFVPVPSGYKTPFGQAVYDTGTLGGAAKEPGSAGPNSTYPTINPTVPGVFAGTLGFTLKGPDGGGASGSSPNCTDNAAALANTTPTGFPINVNVTGNSTYGSDGSIHFTPATPGTYHWLAAYTNSGSANNNSPVNAGCPNGVPDASEAVTVQQIPTDLKSKQSWFPNDTATLCAGTCTTTNGNLVAGGTVDFFLYNDASCGGGTGTVKYSERYTLTGGNPTEEASTHNYTGVSNTILAPNGSPVVPFPITTNYPASPTNTSSSTGSYSWKVVFTPASGDTAHTGSSSSCTSLHTENFSISYLNDAGH